MTSTDSIKLEFTKQMRKATREIHDVSDALVNAKLGFAMSDDKVWAEGLLCFYEIFKYLEGSMDRLGHTLIGDLDIKGMRRTLAFEEDLNFYYGKEWLESIYKISPAVTEYLGHLISVEKNDPILLTAYIYHLYVGLFSGGQILRQKRLLEARIKFYSASTDSTANKGNAVTDFGEIPIAKLKKQMMEAMEGIARQLGEEDKWKLIEESKNVFRMNNKMIRTINTDRVVIRKLVNFTLVAVPVFLSFYFGGRWIRNQL